MGGDHDELPPVEVLGAATEIRSVQAISRGPKGPRRRGMGLIAAALVVAVLVVGATLGGDDEGSEVADREGATSTTHRRPTTTTETRPTTTTATTLPVAAPVFAGHDLHGWLLSGGQGGWTLVDIETGQVVPQRISFDNPYSTRAVTGGVVMVALGGDAHYYDLRLLDDARAPVSLGRADQIIDAVDDDQVWLIDGTRAALVDLSGRELRSFPVPAGAFDSALGPPSAATATSQGLLFARAGRVYSVSEEGVEPVAIGDLIGAVESGVLVYGCGEDGSACGIDLRSLGGSLIRRLDVEQASPDSGWGVTTAGDGQFAVLSHPSAAGDRSVVTLHRSDGATTATLEIPGWMAFAPGWLPNEAGLIGARNGTAAWIYQSSDGLVVEDIPALSDVQSEGVLLIFTE